MKVNNFTRLFKSEYFVAGILCFIFFCCYFILFFLRHTSSDFQSHIQIAYSFAVNDDKMFPNFLYFLLVALFAGFSKHIYLYYGAAIFLLSWAMAAKFLLTDFYLKKYCDLNNTFTKKVYRLLAISMLFVFALPGLDFFTNNIFYLGQLPANVWHNSTVIFLMPFSILLFFKSFNLLFTREPVSKKEQFQIFLLVVVNAIIKPSFLFTIIPTVGLFFSWVYFFPKDKKMKFSLLFPYLLGVIFIGVEYYLIFTKTHVSSITATQKSGVIIAPFVVWKNYSSNLAISFLTSCFFPIVYIVVSRGVILKNKLVQFAIVNYVLAMAIWVFLAESGPRKFDANFCWQMIVATYLLFLVLVTQWVNDFNLSRMSKAKLYFVGTAFSFHFIWGIVYFGKILITRQYY